MKKQFVSGFISSLLLFSLLSGNVAPVLAQDLVGGASEDISGGASVFVFRGSRKPTQVRSSFRASALKQTAERRKTTKIRIKTAVAASSRRKQPTNPNRNSNSNGNSNSQVAGNRNGNRNGNKNSNVTTATMEKAKAADLLAKTAEIALTRGDLDEAERQFKGAQKLNQKSEAAKSGLARISYARGERAAEEKDYQSAINYYQESLRLGGENAPAFAGLGEAFEETNQADKAIKAYENALKLDAELKELNEPLGRLHFAAGNLAQAEKYLAQAAVANPNDFELQNAYALTLYKQNRSTEAITAFQNVIRLDPKNAEAHYNLGEVYDAMDNDKAAIAEYETSIKLNAKNPEVYYDLGVAYFNRAPKDDAKAALPFYEKAAFNYEKAVALKGDYTEARSNLADTYRLTEQFDKAVNQYQVIEAKKPNDADLLNKFGYCLGKTKNWERAIEKLEKSVSITPDAIAYTNLSWAYANAAKVARRNKNAEKSKEYFAKSRDAAQKGVQKDPDSPGAQFNLGNALAQLGDAATAVGAFKNALRIRGNWAEAHNNLGYAFGVLGNLNEAEGEHRAAIKINNDLTDAHANLAVVLARLGKPKDAKKELEIVKKQNPALANQLGSFLKTLTPDVKGAVKSRTVDKIRGKLPF